MGRSRRVLVGLKLYKRDYKQAEKVKTPEQLSLFLYKSEGDVKDKVFQRNLIDYGPNFELDVHKKNLVKEIARLKAEVVGAREYPREYAEKVAADVTGLSPTKALNAEARDYAARASAIYMMARVANLNLPTGDKRILTPLSEGRFYDVVYGSKGQYDRGTILSRMTKVTTHSDPAARARAAEKARELREYRYGDQSSARYN